MTLATKLYQIATREMLKNEAPRLWVDNQTYFGQDLYHLALEARGVTTLLDHEILPTFFSPLSVKLIMRAPSMYWRWSIIREAALMADDASKPISAKAVHQAILRVREQGTPLINKHKQIDELSADETAFWVAAGFILVKTGGLGDSVTRVRNPIFFAA